MKKMPPAEKSAKDSRDADFKKFREWCEDLLREHASKELIVGKGFSAALNYYHQRKMDNGELRRKLNIVRGWIIGASGFDCPTPPSTVEELR